MTAKKILQPILYMTVIGISVILLFFVICCTWIGYEVKTKCQQAKRLYMGDCVTALSSLLEDETRGFRERNDAIWALGQLGDARAVPVLQKMYTGNIPNREPLNSTISQYELKKALNLASGGTNITAVFWRMGMEKQ